MGASPHGDLTVRVPPRIFEDGGSVGHNVRGPGCREGRTDNGVERLSICLEDDSQLDAQANPGVPCQGAFAERLDGQNNRVQAPARSRPPE